MRIKLETISKACYRVCVDSKRIGEFICNDDGYFVFFIDQYNGGYIEAWLLIELGEELNRINKPWDEIVSRYESEHP